MAGDAGASPGPLDGKKVLLGVTGGIAAYKSVSLVRLLTAAGADVQAIMTPAALRFVGADTFAALTRHPVHSDVFERSEVVLHVRLARQADVAVVAPATANAIARMALGLADDLLSSALLEARCPVVVAPAMHTGMWEHTATRANMDTLLERGVTVVRPGHGSLAAGDEGLGRMAEPDEILRAIVEAVGGAGTNVGASPGGASLSGRTILVTAGPTHEPIDAVRYLGNRSSGRMGFAVAAEAAGRGATVVLVSGPVALTDPPGVEVVRVETAEQMARAVLDRYGAVDAVIMAAAVADFRPDRAASGKLKKDGGPPSVALEPTTDILATLGKRKEDQVLVGFAAETDHLESEGRRKLAEKNLDLIVVNEVGREGTGFGAESNTAAILAATGHDTPMRDWTKPDLARAVCDRLEGLLAPIGERRPRPV